MIQYRKITELLAGRLKPKEAYLFYCLALKSDFLTNESYITQGSLAKFYGIKDVDQIREWLYKFQSKGLAYYCKKQSQGAVRNISAMQVHIKRRALQYDF